ncbi:hypothetical protein [Pseudomonas mandelii]|uniref:hypothetical protein n=1 Tax=Pseudomonas mandelii TaxID=75612 RepID=UPI003C76099D
MRNLPAPTVNDRIMFLKIANAKTSLYKPLLLKIRPNVNARYKEYISYVLRLEDLPISTMNAASAKALVKCYSSRTKHLTDLRGQLLYPDIEDFDECPLCGIGEPDTLDHYLPKDEFPEFSTFSKNLIPVCGPCNSSYKGLKWIANGKRIFIHTYYDTFPAFCFMSANVAVGPKISIAFNPLRLATHPDFSDLFERHFKKLKLNDRYKRKAASEISRKRRRLEAVYRRNGLAADVAKALLAEAVELRKEFSQNHWKPVLYEALSTSPDFCDGGFRKIVSK